MDRKPGRTEHTLRYSPATAKSKPENAARSYAQRERIEPYRGYDRQPQYSSDAREYRDYGGERATRRSETDAKRKKHKMALFTAIVIFAGVIISVSAFGLMLSQISNEAQTPPPVVKSTPGLPAMGDIKKELKQVCLIKDTNKDTKTLTLYGVFDGRYFYASVVSSTEMKDSYGKNLAFGEFKAGDIVDISYYEGEPSLLSIRISPQSQAFTGQDGIIVDPENSTITRGNRSYIYGQELVCVYKGEAYDPARVSPVDVVTLRVYQGVALFLEVTKSHGIIDVTFNSHIRDGIIEIDTSHHSSLDSNRQFPVPEGVHKIVVKGSNIANFIREINVNADQVTELSLADVQILSGFLYFSSNAPGVNITVNGNAVNIDSSLGLEYGTYEIRATAMGYEPYAYMLDFKSPMQTLTINMKPLPTPTPIPTRAPQPDTIKAEINTNVPGAEVYIDGMYAGRTTNTDAGEKPLVISVEVGFREVKIIKEGYCDWYYERYLFETGTDITVYMQEINSTIQ